MCRKFYASGEQRARLVANSAGARVVCRDMRPIVRDALGIGAATGAAGLSYGALAAAAGLSTAQTCTLSLLMFTGASQFAFIGLIGGGAGAAIATALLLGLRNGLYGLRLAPFLRPRPLAAQFVI